MLDTFTKQLNHLNITHTAPLLLAVSGGLDSMVLAHLFEQSGWPFAVAHCNFGLRAEESDGDADFVRQWANARQIPYFERRFDTKEYATTQGISIQMAARDLRYEWLADVCATHRYAGIATAHHLNDQTETMLLNWTRGTGLRGLTGIAGHSEWTTAEGLIVALYRPLLFATRADVHVFATQEGIKWREDSSNEKDVYARNAIRHHVVPQLESINPNFLKTAERSMSRLAEVTANYEWLLAQVLGFDVQRDGTYSLDKKTLLRLPAPVHALYDLLRDYGYSYEQARQLIEGIEHTGLQIQSEAGHSVLIDRTHLLLRLPEDVPDLQWSLQIQDDDLMIRLPGGQQLFMVAADPTPPYPDGCSEVLVDASKLVFPLQVRPWKAGDTFQPFGMHGQHQKIQDYLTDRKLTRTAKAATQLLLNHDGTVIWVLGHRMDERYKLTKSSKFARKFRLVI